MECVVTDNAANQLKALRLSSFQSISCSAHTIQLAIKDSFTECSYVSEMVKKCEKIVKYFKKSGPAMLILTKAQQQLNCKELKLLQNVKTRWNSEFYMIHRVYEMKEPLVLALSKIPSLASLSVDEWLMCDELIDLLGPVEALTRTLCGETYSTISLLIPILKAITSHLTKMVIKCATILKFRACLVKFLAERFETLETNKIMLVATLMNPRFKKSTKNFYLLLSYSAFYLC